MRYVAGFGLWVTLAAAQSTVEVGTVVLDGRPVQYAVQDGYAVLQGDVIWGPVAELEAEARREETGSKDQRYSSIANVTPWTNATIPYIIEDDVPNQQRISAAIAHWQSRTTLKIVPRAGETNYVRFRRVSGDFACTSALGMRGGEQLVQMTDVCTAGNVIHELGHAFGLLHEQERLDRNRYVTVLYPNIDKRFLSAFDQTTASRDAGYYDYDSIMHYGVQGFSRNGLDSLATVPVGIPIGQRTELSAGDIDQINRLYGIRPTRTTVTTMPAGLSMIVDGQARTSPQSFEWAPGTTHTISVNPRQGTADPLYSFVRWTDNGALEHNVIASPDQTAIAAVFQLQHKLEARAGSAQGTVSLRPSSADGYYPDGLAVLVAATPAGGSRFVRWTGATNLTANGYGVSAPRATIDVGIANGLYEATFTTAAITTVTSEPLGRTVVVDGTSYLTPINLVFAAGSTHSVSLQTTQSAGNNTARHRFTGWSDGETSATRNFVAGAAIVARFTTQYLLTTTFAGTGTITVSPPSQDGFYDAGTSVTLSAPGQDIRYWLGDTLGSANSQTVVMDEQKYAAAVFASPLLFRPVSSASYWGSPFYLGTGSSVGPLEIITLFGSNLGPDTLVSGQLDDSGRLATRLGNTRILFDGVPAPLVYASANQTSAIVPAAIAQRTTTAVGVERNGTAVGVLTIGTTPTKPALYTANASGQGQLAALNQDGTVNSPLNPAESGSVVVLYGTGSGLWDRAVPDGQIMDANLARPQGAVEVKFGKLSGEIFYAGSAPFLVNGLLQVNVRVPAETLPGAVPVQLSVGTWTSPPGTTISVR